MKMRYNILFFAVALFTAVACTKDAEVIDLNSDIDAIDIDASGGVKKVRIASSGDWVASVGMQADGTANPWITVSPANGRGSVTCDFVIDSALTINPRSAVVSITNLATNKTRRITVNQKGYEYTLEIDKKSVELKKFAEYGKRYFDITVKTNYPFVVDVPNGQSWISPESASRLGDAYKLDLNRGARPREVKVRFNWKINNSDRVRLADIKFLPTSEDITVAHSDILSVSQEAAEPIIPETRGGDSLALLNIVNTMQCWNIYDSSTTMDTWSGVTLWEERMEGCTPEKVGRVRKVKIFLCNSYEELPYEFQYLTQADEIYIFSNENSMLKSLNLGEHICKLTNLKRLTVGAYGLTELPEAFKNLKNLEYLDLGSNNFQRVPEIITHENFPKLRALVMNAQQRHAVSDLSNTRYTTEKLGGLVEEEKIPEHLLLWGENKEGLDTLVLSVNYLHGSLPTFEGDEYPKWTEADVIAADTLPQALVGTPKIMTKTKTFCINHNRLSGELPKWLLMHPSLDWWVPFSLVFPQEGRWTDGTMAGFNNAPASLVDYYKNWYPNKKLANTIEEEIPEDDSEIINK